MHTKKNDNFREVFPERVPGDRVDEEMTTFHMYIILTLRSVTSVRAVPFKRRAHLRATVYITSGVLVLCLRRLSRPTRLPVFEFLNGNAGERVDVSQDLFY